MTKIKFVEHRDFNWSESEINSWLSSEGYNGSYRIVDIKPIYEKKVLIQFMIIIETEPDCDD